MEKTFRVIISLAILLCLTRVAFAQSDESLKCAVIVKQSFHGWKHCSSTATPEWNSCTVTLDGKTTPMTSDYKAVFASVEIDNAKGSFPYKLKNGDAIKLVVNLQVSHIDDHSEYVDTIIPNALTTKTQTKEFKSKCFLKKHEGYSVSHDITIDDPILLQHEEINKTSWVIEDKEKVRLHFNRFFENNLSRRFQYKILSQDNSQWENFKSASFNNNVVISPNGEVEISYEDIFGYDRNDTEYKNASGKQIGIRVVKTLSGDKQTQTPSNVVLARFFHRGPDFEIESSRRPYCSQKPLEIYVKLSSISDKLNCVNEFYKWQILQIGENGTIKHEIKAVNFERLQPEGDLYKISVGADDSIYINGKDAVDGKWEMQLQFYKDNKCDTLDNTLVFPSHEFTISPKLNQVSLSQTVINDGLIESGQLPYVLATIEDDDPQGSRAPYKVYEIDSEGNRQYLMTIKGLKDAIDYNNDASKQLFNSSNKNLSFDITKEMFVKDKFAKWYAASDLASRCTEKVESAIIPDKSTSSFNVNSANMVVDADFQTLFFRKSDGTWIRLSFEDREGAFYNSTCATINNVVYMASEGNLYTTLDYSVPDVEVSTQSVEEGLYCVAQSSNSLLTRHSDSNNLTLYTFTENNYNTSNINNSYINMSKAKVSLYRQDGEQHILMIEDEKLAFGNNNGFSITAKLAYKPYLTQDVDVCDDYITYKANGNVYRHYYSVFDEIALYDLFQNNSAIISNDYFDDDWSKFCEKRDKAYELFLAKKSSYNLTGLNHYSKNENNGIVECAGNIVLEDKDGCESNVMSYTFKYNNLVLNTKVRQYPKSLVELDGVVEVEFSSGSAGPYVINGEELDKVLQIDNLGFGDTNIEVTDAFGFTFEYTVTIPKPTVDVQIQNYRCESVGGSISIKSQIPDVQRMFLERDTRILESQTIEDGSFSFQHLSPGAYDLYVVMKNGNTIELDTDLSVGNDPFTVERQIQNANRLDEEGIITLTANTNGSVLWNGSLGTNQATFQVPVGTYNYVVEECSSGCVANLEPIVISGPDYLGWADIRVKGGFATIDYETRNENGISESKIILNGQEVTNSSTIAYHEGDCLELKLQYKVNSKTDWIEHELLKAYPPSGSTKVSDMSKEDRCEAEDGAILIESSSTSDDVQSYYQINDGIEYRIDGPEYVTAKPGTYTVSIRQQISQQSDFISASVSQVYEHKMDIDKVQARYFDVDAQDVSCHGMYDGALLLSKDDKGNGSAWLRMGSKDYKNGEITGLGAGDVVYYIVEERCPELAQERKTTISGPSAPLKATIVEVFHPTCNDNDGSVALEVKGGWGGYRKIVDVEKYKEDKESYIESIGEQEIANGNVLSYDKLSHGPQHFTVVDDGLCELHIDDIELKQYTNPQITEATTVPAECYGSADGEMAIDTVIVDPSVKGLDLLLSVNGGESETLSSPYQTIIKGLKEGYYTLRVSDANECKSDEITVHISQPKPLKLEARLLDEGRIQYNGGSDGRMKITVSGGNSGNNNIVTYGDGLAVVHTGVPYIVEGMSEGPIEISAKD